jgi:hypothetical protein
MIITYKDWHEMISYVFHSYWTIVRTFIGAIPYPLVYEMEVVMPFKVEIHSLRVLKESKWVSVLYEQLNFISEEMLLMIFHG